MKCILDIVIMREVKMRDVNLRGIDLNLLTVLDILLEHRNVTRAAEAAGMSQPAMSRALGRLRALLRDPILARGVDGFVATPRALALRPALSRALAEIRAVVTIEDFDPARWRGAITIATTDHQSILLLPAVLARLAREAPGVDVAVVPFSSEALAALREGRLALSFAIDEVPLAQGLRAERLHRDSFVTMLREDHPAADGPWTPETFAALDHVLVTVTGEGGGAIDAELARLGLARRVALRLPHFLAAFAVVAESDLVVTLPLSLAERFAPVFGLARRAPPLPRPPFTATMIWPEMLDDDPACRWFRAVVREEATRLAGPDAHPGQ